MIIRNIEQYERLNTAKCTDSLFSLVESYASSLGFEYCTFILRMPLPLTRRNISVFSNCPIAMKNWDRRGKGRAESNRTIQEAAPAKPVVWSGDYTLPVRESWNGTCFCGLHVGWSHSNRDANGVVGTLILGRAGEPLTNIELQSRELSMLRLAQLTHLKMSQILTMTMMPEAGAKLTEREVEVLRWTGDGKTSAETSEILKISERTVNFHVANAMAKFNTTNKTAAVARAVTLGLLS